MNNKQKFYSLQLIRYLMSVRNYLQVSVVNTSENNQPFDDYWLVSPTSTNYQVIHISDESDSLRNRKLPVVVYSVQKIKEIFNIGSISVLDISLDDFSSNYKLNEIQYVSLKPGCELPPEVSNEFPNLSKIIYLPETDMEGETKKLEKEIALFSLKNQAVMSRVKQKDDIKKMKKPLFMVPAVICVIMFIIVNFAAYNFNQTTITTAIAFGGYYKAFITILHQYWRVLTGGFIHISPIHLLVNLMSLYQLSQPIEAIYGEKKGFIILLVSIIVGNLFVFIGGTNNVTVGISGGLFGLLGASLVGFWQKGYFKNRQFTSGILRVLYLNLLVSLLPNVSLLGHLGGLAAGVFLGFVLNTDIEKFLKINFAICGIVLAILLSIMSVKYKDFVQFYYGTDLAVAEVYEAMDFNGLAKKIRLDCYEYYAKGE